MRLKKYLETNEYAPVDEGKGTFGYVAQSHADTHRSLENLIRTNNGVFKSTKQQWFLTKGWKWERQIGAGKDPIFDSPSHVQKMRGIKGTKKGEYLVEVSAYMQFGKGTGQGTRRIEWGYVCDDAGVREKYKYGFTYHEGGTASSIDIKKTKREWQRQENDQVSAFKEEAAQEEAARKEKTAAKATDLMRSEYLGVIGERVKGVKVEVLRKHFFETQFGESSITVMRDEDGNMIQHFGRNSLKQGDKKTVDFTVKAHEEAKINKWNKVPYKLTMVQRVKVS